MKNFVFNLFLLFFHKFTHQCQWQPYRTVNEGPYQGGSLVFSVRRSTEICVNKSTIYNFRTSRTLIPPISFDWVCKPNNDFGVCSGSCNSTTIRIFILCIATAAPHTAVYVSFNYVNKNCDKAYWSSCTQKTSCSNNSNSFPFTRTARDCDQQPFPNSYRVNGYMKKEPCQNWSTWEETTCFSPNCSSEGQLVKTRKCVYENGNVVSNSTLCSNDTSVVIEQCTVNVTCSTSIPANTTEKVTSVNLKTSASFELFHNNSSSSSNAKSSNSQTHRNLSSNTIAIIVCSFFIVVFSIATGVLLKLIHRRKVFNVQAHNDSAKVVESSTKKRNLARIARGLIKI